MFDFNKLSPAQLAAIPAEMKAAYLELQEKNARLTAEKTSRISFKVSQKGAISVYGMGRFPMTLYPTQWDALFATSVSFQEFIEKNRKLCDAQSTLWERLESEGKAKGHKDAALENYIKDTLRLANNPYVSMSTAQ